MAGSNRSIYAIVDKMKVHISAFSNDTRYTDEFIYSVLLPIRTLLLHRELEKNKSWSPFLYKTICMPLELSSNIPCDCIPEGTGCVVLKSKFKVPKPIRLRRRDIMDVLTLDGYDEFPYAPVVKGKYRKYRRTKADEAYYTIYNEYLYIIGYPDNNLKGVLLSIIMEDPCEADGISMCDENMNPLEDTCFNPLTDTFQIDKHLEDVMIEMALKTLGFSIQLPDDISNNSSGTSMKQAF